MKTLRRGWRRLLGALGGGRSEDELADEIAAHLAMLVEENLRAGMSPAEAVRAARLKFGNAALVQESYRAQRGLPRLEGLTADFRQALRGLRKTPGFTAVAVLTLALGIGAITAVFSLVNQVLLAPPGIRNPEHVLAVRTVYGKLNLDLPVSSPRSLTDLQEIPQVFEHAALMSPADANYSGGIEPRRLRGALVTAEWFDVFGARPLLGRVFSKEECRPNADRVLVLSYAAWSSLFGKDPEVLGRSIELNRTPRRIVGVMPPEFRWPQNVDLWAPLGLPDSAFGPGGRFRAESFLLVARTRPNVDFRQASQWMSVITSRVRNGTPPGSAIAKEYDWRISATAFTQSIAGDTRKPLLILLGAVALVLLIVCSNIAGLLLARGSARIREFSVRAALGAGRTRLLRSMLAESILLAMAGGIGAVAFADTGVNLLLTLAPRDVAAGLSARMDSRVLLFGLAVSLVSALLCGLLPAWQISRIDPNAGLKNDDRFATTGRGRSRMRSALVMAQTALALVLLVAAGLFLQSFERLQAVNPGFDPRGVMTAVVSLPLQAYPTDAAQQVFFRTLLARLQNNPQVAAAALGNAVPFTGAYESDVFEIEGRVPGPGQPLPHGDVHLVTPDFFHTLNIPLQRGRYFNDADRAGSEPVAIIDESLAREYWPGEDPIGKRIRNRDWYRIVGVVRHVMHSDLAADSGKGVYYFSLFQRTVPMVTIVAKARGDAGDLAGAIRNAEHDADPRQALYSFDRMEDLVRNSLAPRRFAMRILLFFAGAALFLAALGLYGVISYAVTQRSREIGIRMALGAAPRGLLRLLIGHGLRLAALGIAAGAAGSLAAARLIRSQLFGVSALDPLTIVAMGAILLAVAALASYLPARRATRVDPLIALRPE